MPTITQWKRPRVSLWSATSTDPADRLDLDRLVTAITAQKDVDAPTGSWSVTLAPSQGALGVTDARRLAELYKRVQPNDVVSLGVQTDGGILLGLVTAKRRSETRSGARASVSVVLQGTCLGKVLVQDTIVQAALTVPAAPEFMQKVEDALGEDHPLLMVLPGVWGPDAEDTIWGAIRSDGSVRGTPSFLAQTVKDVADWVLANASSMRLPVMAAATGGDGKPSDYFDTSSITTWNDGRVYSEGLASFEGTIFDMLRGTLDQDFYEIRVDFVPSDGSRMPTPHLIMRPKPFDEPAMEWLPVAESTGLTWAECTNLVNGEPWHEIGRHEILRLDLGVDDLAAFGWYQVSAAHELISNPSGEQEGLYYPAVDLWNVKRHGIRSYRARMALVSPDVRSRLDNSVDYAGDVAPTVREMRNRLLNWHRMAPRFEKGTIVVAGRDNFRVGDRVWLPDEWAPTGGEQGMVYYLAGVQWSWSFGGPYTSTLRVTRGHNDGMITAMADEIAADMPGLDSIAET